jgi:hypothetical protein
MKNKLVAVMLVLGTVWGCSSSERTRGAGGTGGTEEGTGGSAGSGGAGTGGSRNTGGTGSGGNAATGGSGPSTGGSGGGAGGSAGRDASADATAGTSADGPAMSGGDLWAKCGPEAYKADVSAADFCARYISVCKPGVSMDACVTMYNGLSPGPRQCRACTAYYACIASSPEVMAMSCMYITQGLGKNGPCKPSYCD